MAHENVGEEAAAWLDRLLAGLPARESPTGWPGLFAAANELSPAMQVAVLRECVSRMPVLRFATGRARAQAEGSALYALACELYGRELPLEAGDLCALLASSRHFCGHGGDVSPPLDAAWAYLRRHGFSAPIAEAVRDFVEGLAGVRSSQAHFIKRRAAILLLANPDDSLRAESGWSAHFRAGLRALPAAELSHWQRFVLEMKANDVYEPPATFRRPAEGLIAALTAPAALERLGEWFAVDDRHLTLHTGGSHVLKHLVWLALRIAEGEQQTDRCDALVVGLSKLRWRPRERAVKVIIATACYLRRRPPAVAWEPLRELTAWSVEPADKLDSVVRAYASEHGLAIPDPAKPTDRTRPTQPAEASSAAGAGELATRGALTRARAWLASLLRPVRGGRAGP